MSKKARVKICGIKEESTLRDMAELPVHYVGFMFVAASRRRVTAEQAAKLIAASRVVNMADGNPPLAVGVFVNPTINELRDVLAQAPLDVVQLHGDETPAFCREVRDTFGVDVWRALPVAEPGSSDADESGSERLEAYKGSVSTILIDTAGGGTGRTFRWDLIPSYQRIADRLGLKLIVAGGLSQDNVEELLALHTPYGVDISSGVETEGAKDSVKIAAFAERVNRS
ncbi:phosphoribosylanthranilate isomerase [Cohnella faecalis]|uniref:N-(5'-phosphoribosyl)anthranilate isomerase n=1 Tax=Cohnella faecalis TaxID=2315694 RepID=A0A398CXY7_9BACL|nr:phosphoribosylanthranilate isomerase [Cohnella faecalis]RIE04657.1 phosphoribosylanthranilate isomerase [Cohnella faecalis]